MLTTVIRMNEAPLVIASVKKSSYSDGQTLFSLTLPGGEYCFILGTQRSDVGLPPQLSLSSKGRRNVIKDVSVKDEAVKEEPICLAMKGVFVESLLVYREGMEDIYYVSQPSLFITGL